MERSKFLLRCQKIIRTTPWSNINGQKDYWNYEITYSNDLQSNRYNLDQQLSAQHTVAQLVLN